MNSEVFEPLVSIVIPAYNASNYLGEAIESALAQSYRNVEIIVVNDGSKDDGATRNVALSFGDKIRYFEKENGGSSSALNVGIANMKGDWFSWLSHDDLYYPQKVERQIEYINSLKLNKSELSKHIFFSASELIDAEGSLIRPCNIKHAEALAKRVSSFSHNGYLIAEPTEYLFHGCSCLIHREAFSDVGCFDEKLRLLNDMDLWFRLYSANYRVHFIPEILVKGRVHSKQVSKSIGYSYHNPEQDMYWNRSLNWLIDNYPDDGLLYKYGRNAYLKTRNAEGDRAFDSIKGMTTKKLISKPLLKAYAWMRNFVKTVYIKVRT